MKIDIQEFKMHRDAAKNALVQERLAKDDRELAASTAMDRLRTAIAAIPGFGNSGGSGARTVTLTRNKHPAVVLEYVDQ